jgi:dipeptidyl aminopeptidase/acylaminoacyl peptidase
MSKTFLIIITMIMGIAGLYFLFNPQKSGSLPDLITDSLNNLDEGGLQEPHQLSIEYLSQGEYPGSDIVLERTLEPGVNYQRYIASYTSEGLKIYGLLTVPNGKPPEGGWPAIIFNHGYIAPSVYQTTERYVAYQDGFARNGYVSFKADYRGHADSEGQGSGGYGSSGYTIDVLNATSSIKKYPGVNPEKIGMWGHSMGGHITLRNMVISKDIKAGVIWAGVVASYPDLLTNWRRNRPSPTVSPTGGRRWRQELTEAYGTPEENPEFWNSISATSYLSDISGPLQLHHGTSDSSVPHEFSEKLFGLLENMGKEAEFYSYEGDDHNISKGFSTAMNRSIEFFDKYLK